MEQALSKEIVDQNLAQLEEKWDLLNYEKIERTFRFSDFEAAMDFVQKVAELAEEENHHPDICIYYTKVRITLWTHAVGGLSPLDFEIARKIETLVKNPIKWE